MDPADQAHREKKLFEQALDVASPEERLAFLKGACGEDAAMLARVQALLQAHQAAEGFLPGQPAGQPSLLPVNEKPGDRIGRYKLREKIGEGGCGVVYVAEQEEPVRRKVALKVIKLGMDTKNVVARFEAERQALAMMDHPNIAKVLDAGATETGRPYFVMELVRGVKITDYCDQHQLPTHERLELFIKVCQAVQHAHQKGIIHRDLKPSNILVTVNDGAPVPKVIDFGIAKATEGRLTDATVYTDLYQFIGTPAYMSPEQAEMTTLDIDTRSDIYSLGVLLYELLTGKTPFDPKELLVKGIEEMRRAIREQEPPTPSTRLTTMDKEELTTTAKRRQTDAPKLVHLVRGDLDWIVMKCLEKDRTRRYETANGLAFDLLRHVNNEPVLARPPSKVYQFQKMVRRNKGAFVAATLMAVVLMLATGISAWQAVLATRAGNLAAKRLAEFQAQQSLANQRLAESEAISEFLRGVIESPNPMRNGHTVTVTDILGAAARRLETDLAYQPARRAKLQASLGETYASLGLFREALPLQEKVRDYFLVASGVEHPDTLTATHNLARSYYNTGRHDEALKLQEQVLTLRRKVLGPEHRDTLTAMSALAESYHWAGRGDDSLKLLEQLLPLRRKLLGPEDPDTIATLWRLAYAYDEVGRQEEALKMREQSLALSRKVLGPEHPSTLTALRQVPFSYIEVGRQQEALKMREESLALHRKVLGPEHPGTLAAMRELAESYDDANRLDDALKLREAWLSLSRKVNGPENSLTLQAILHLAESYHKANRLDEALKLREEALALYRKVNGPEQSETMSAMHDVADSYDAAGRRAEAFKLREEALDLSRKVNGPEHRQTIQFLDLVAWNLATSDAPELRNGTNAVRLAEEAVAATHRKNASCLDTLAAAYAETQQFDKAVALEQEALAQPQSEKNRKECGEHLKLYQAHQPYREPAYH